MVTAWAMPGCSRRGLRRPARSGYLAAVRMIDAAGLVNVNVANETRPAAAGQVMGPSDVALAALAGELDVQGLKTARDVGPFDLGDLLAVTWRATRPSATTSGRLSTCLLGTAGGHLTTVSASRLAVPQRGAAFPPISPASTPPQPRGTSRRCTAPSAPCWTTAAATRRSTPRPHNWPST